MRPIARVNNFPVLICNIVGHAPRFIINSVIAFPVIVPEPHTICWHGLE